MNATGSYATEYISTLAPYPVEEHLSPLQKKLRDLLDILKSRLPGNNVEESFLSVIDDLFDIQMLAILESFSKPKKEINAQFMKVVKEIYSNGNNPELSSTIIEVFNVFNQISSQSKSAKANRNDDKKLAEKELTFEEYISVIKTIPVATREVFIELVDSLLAINFVVYCHFWIGFGLIKVQKSIEKELLSFIKRAINRYGASQALLNNWEPPEDDDSPIITSIRILVAAKKVQKGVGKTVSIGELKQLITN